MNENERRVRLERRVDELEKLNRALHTALYNFASVAGNVQEATPLRYAGETLLKELSDCDPG